MYYGCGFLYLVPTYLYLFLYNILFHLCTDKALEVTPMLKECLLWNPLPSPKKPSKGLCSGKIFMSLSEIHVMIK
jgi:hypothetical protein